MTAIVRFHCIEKSLGIRVLCYPNVLRVSITARHCVGDNYDDYGCGDGSLGGREGSGSL